MPLSGLGLLSTRTWRDRTWGIRSLFRLSSARGVEVPMLVIFLGAIGGFISSGFIGLFIGAVVLSLGDKLVTQWIQTEAGGAVG